MGRAVRRVPVSWQHPYTRDEQSYLPMHETFPYNEEEIAEGLREGWMADTLPHYGCDVMPDWPDAERTHYQMYEDTTEGTPISPVCATPEELARWLVDHHASFFGGMETSYEHWLGIILGTKIGLPVFGDIAPTKQA